MDPMRPNLTNDDKTETELSEAIIHEVSERFESPQPLPTPFENISEDYMVNFEGFLKQYTMRIKLKSA